MHINSLVPAAPVTTKAVYCINIPVKKASSSFGEIVTGLPQSLIKLTPLGDISKCPVTSDAPLFTTEIVNSV